MMPNFLIIGAMKAGTGSLWHYLRQHPEIFMPPVKELDYFVEEKNWVRGWDWYEGQYRNGQPGIRAYGEASTNYSKYPYFSGVPQRIAGALPDTKLIYLVRDPIERIRSMYVHLVHTGEEIRKFPQAMADLQNNHYVELSLYNFQLTQYLPFFSLEKVLVIASEDLRDRRRQTLIRVFQFLGVRDGFDTDAFDERVNMSTHRRKINVLGRLFWHVPQRERILSGMPGFARRFYRDVTTIAIPKPTISDVLWLRLVEAIQQDTEGFRGLIGQDFQSWSL